MGDWKKTGHRKDFVEQVAEVFTLGVIKAADITEVTNAATGEVKEVYHHSAKQLGEKISAGRFVKK